MKKRPDRKLFGLRRPPLFAESLEPRAVQAREAAGALIGGEIASRVELVRILAEFVPGVSIEWSGEWCRFAAPRIEELPKLPSGYFLKGGAARLALARVLGLGAPPPRDLDIVRFGGRWCEEDARVSREFMPHDFERGWGVELCPDIGAYLGSRDLSINEVVCGSGAVQATPIAILDFIGGVLRPCKYRPGSLHRAPMLRSAAVVKMMRLRAEGIVDGRVWSIVGVPAGQEIEPFDAAIQLDKAFARGPVVAEAFLEQCAAVGLYPSPALDDSAPGRIDLIHGVAAVWDSVYDPEGLFGNIPPEISARVVQLLRDRSTDLDEEPL